MLFVRNGYPVLVPGPHLVLESSRFGRSCIKFDSQVRATDGTQCTRISAVRSKLACIIFREFSVPVSELLRRNGNKSPHFTGRYHGGWKMRGSSPQLEAAREMQCNNGSKSFSRKARETIRCAQIAVSPTTRETAVVGVTHELLCVLATWLVHPIECECQQRSRRLEVYTG